MEYIPFTPVFDLPRSGAIGDHGHVGHAQLDQASEELLAYALGGEYEVRFRLGTIVEQRVRLSSFRILRRGQERKPLIHTNLILPLEQTTSFVLARTEESREALMVVLTLRQGKAKGD